MFTGIVEETGIISSFSKHTNGAVLTIECKNVLQDSKIGDSIAINGVCQTITKLTDNSFTADVSEETLAVTTFSELKNNDIVNLERALTLSSRLGGHIVTGHVDCIGRLLSYKKLSEFYNFEFEIPQDFTKYVVKKGSITINGISLTVAGAVNNIIKIALIPHTIENTNLKYLKSGDYVNIETDILAKYVEKMTQTNNNSSITMNFLQENGFL